MLDSGSAAPWQELPGMFLAQLPRRSQPGAAHLRHQLFLVLQRQGVAHQAQKPRWGPQWETHVEQWDIPQDENGDENG